MYLHGRRFGVAMFLKRVVILLTYKAANDDTTLVEVAARLRRAALATMRQENRTK